MASNQRNERARIEQEWAEVRLLKESYKEPHLIAGWLAQALALIGAQKEWIMAVPADTPLPAMPGFDRDFADELEAKLRKAVVGQKCRPTFTECPRCKNDVTKCDGALAEKPNPQPFKAGDRVLQYFSPARTAFKEADVVYAHENGALDVRDNNGILHGWDACITELAPVIDRKRPDDTEGGEL